jgi:8-oxo-dGTP pyrophosphatase MutT (NUDIX family)
MLERRRASIVCVAADELLCVRLRVPGTRSIRLFVPGGGIEPGEAPAAAAERETLEETGYAVCADPDSAHIARYLFNWDGRDVDVTTHFFRARLCGDKAAPAPVHDVEYNLGVVWLPLARLEAELGFHTEILRAVRALIS